MEIWFPVGAILKVIIFNRDKKVTLYPTRTQKSSNRSLGQILPESSGTCTEASNAPLGESYGTDADQQYVRL